MCPLAQPGLIKASCRYDRYTQRSKNDRRRAGKCFGPQILLHAETRRAYKYQMEKVEKSWWSYYFLSDIMHNPTSVHQSCVSLSFISCSSLHPMPTYSYKKDILITLPATWSPNHIPCNIHYNRSSMPLLHRHTLGQVPREVNIDALGDSQPVCHELKLSLIHI